MGEIVEHLEKGLVYDTVMDSLHFFNSVLYKVIHV